METDMARIRFNISAALTRWRAREAMSPQRFRMMDLQALHERPRGPGWFDSSWDLDHGLEVEIAVPGDPPFQAWIEAQARAFAQLAAQAAARQAAQPAAQPAARSAVELHVATPVEGSLEFESVDWRAWAPPEGATDASARMQAAGLDMPELNFEWVGLDGACAPAPARELALV